MDIEEQLWGCFSQLVCFSSGVQTCQFWSLLLGLALVKFLLFLPYPFQKFLLETKPLWMSALISYSLLFWASLQGPKWNTGGNTGFLWAASWLKTLDRDLRVFFPQLCVTDLQQTILSSCFLSVMMIEMFPFFLPLSVLSIYILGSLGQGLSLDSTKADRQRHWPCLGSLSVNVITVPEQWMSAK